MEENNTTDNKKKIKRNMIIVIACTIIVFFAIGLGYCYFSRDESEVNDTVYSTYEVVESGNMQFEIEKFYNTTTLYVWNSNYTDFEAYDTVNNFIVITLRVTNVGRSSIKFEKGNIKLLSADYTYNVHQINDKIEGGINGDTSIAPSLSREFKIVFQTPESTASGNYMLYLRGGENQTWQRILLTGDGTGGYY